jgi:hypothetical protein
VMVVGIVVRNNDAGESGAAVVMYVEVNWPVLPRTGERWICCRRPPFLPRAVIQGFEWGGGALDKNDVAAWLFLSAPQKLISHLVNEHGFWPET